MAERNLSRSELSMLLKICGITFMKFLSVGVIFSLAILGISVFQGGQRAAYLRYLSIAPILVLGTIGLVQAGIVLGTYLMRRPKE